MDKNFQRLLDQVLKGVDDVSDIKAQYLDKIKDAKKRQELAIKAKDEAKDETGFKKACDDEHYARDLELFWRKKLEEITFTPRMDDELYHKTVDTISKAVNESADEYISTVKKIICELTDARDKYLMITSAADHALQELDEKANVLQCKYRYRKTLFEDKETKIIEDPSEWKRHAVRFDVARAHELVTNVDNQNKSHIVRPAYITAWKLAEDANKPDYRGV